MSYWKAQAHQWGSGQIHVIHQNGLKTLCGKALAECPGQYVPENEYTCRACAKVIDAEESRRLNEERWRRESGDRQREQEAADRDWWRRYNAYLQSPAWQARRAAVFKRAKSICEACGKARAVEVHHKSYRYVGCEPLFDLAAVCSDCHAFITEMDRMRRDGLY